MKDIIKDEKRMPKIGEACFVRIKDIKRYDIPVENTLYNKRIEIEDSLDMEGYTILVYTGRGKFLDPVSYQVVAATCSIASHDKYLKDEKSKMEAFDMNSYDRSIRTIAGYDDFMASSEIILESPFIIDFDNAHIYSKDNIELIDEFKKLDKKEFTKHIKSKKEDAIRILTNEVNVVKFTKNNKNVVPFERNMNEEANEIIKGRSM